MTASQGPWFETAVWKYWDQQSAAIFNFTNRLAGLADDERSSALEEIRAHIVEHVSKVSDETLVQLAVSLTDDLYKALTSLSEWNACYPEYLAACAATFNEQLAKRGFVTQYVIDNAYEPTEHGLAGPRTYFGNWFSAAGFKYICPQQLVEKLMAADGRENDYFGALPQYLAEGRMLADRIVRTCQEQGFHYYFLDTDATPESLAAARATAGKDGSIGIFRSEAPTPGSKCAVSFPKSS